MDCSLASSSRRSRQSTTMMGELAAAERKRMAESAKTAAPPGRDPRGRHRDKMGRLQPGRAVIGRYESIVLDGEDERRPAEAHADDQTFSAPVDPESVKLEQAWRRERELNEEEDIRRAIADVKKAKADYGEDGWVDAVRRARGLISGRLARSRRRRRRRRRAAEVEKETEKETAMPREKM